MVILVMITNEVLSFATDPLECLHQVWKFYSKKESFEMIRGDWPSQYWDLLDKMDPTLIEVWPNNEYQDSSGQPASMDVRIRPKGLELLHLHQWQRPREVHRQVTIDGKKVDLRNDRARMIVTMSVESLVALTPIWIEQLQIEREPRPQRAMRLQLERLLAYRGPDLPLILKDKVITALMNHNKKVNGYLNQTGEGVSECVGV